MRYELYQKAEVIKENGKTETLFAYDFGQNLLTNNEWDEVIYKKFGKRLDMILS